MRCLASSSFCRSLAAFTSRGGRGGRIAAGLRLECFLHCAGGTMIRRADAADVQFVRDLVERAYTVYVARMGRRPAPMDDDYDQKTQQGQVFVADVGAIVAAIVLTEAPGHLLIENATADPHRQGTGL